MSGLLPMTPKLFASSSVPASETATTTAAADMNNTGHPLSSEVVSQSLLDSQFTATIDKEKQELDEKIIMKEVVRFVFSDKDILSRFPRDERYDSFTSSSSTSSSAIQTQLWEIDVLRLYVYIMAESFYLAMKNFPVSEVGHDDILKLDLLSQAEHVAKIAVPLLFSKTERLTSLDPSFPIQPIHEENNATIQCFHEVLVLLERFDGSEQDQIPKEFVDELDQVISRHDQNQMIERFEKLFKITTYTPKKLLEKKDSKQLLGTPKTAVASTAATTTEHAREAVSSTAEADATGEKQHDGAVSKKKMSSAAIGATVIGGVVGGLLLGPAGWFIGANLLIGVGAAAVGIGLGAGTGVTVNHFVERKQQSSQQQSPNEQGASTVIKQELPVIDTEMEPLLSQDSDNAATEIETTKPTKE